MGRQHETRGADAKKRMIGRRRLPAEDVDARAAQRPRLERLGQGDLVHDLARAVLMTSPRAGAGRRALARAWPGWRGVGNVQADDVGLREERVELLEAHAERLLLRRRRAPDIEVADLGVERLEPFRHLPADGAQPHEGDEPAPELPGVEPRVAAGPVPLAAPELRLSLGQPPEHGQHQEQRELGHGYRVGAGGDGHRDPPRARRRQVDLVDADPPLLDEPEPGRRIHQARRDARDAAHEERRALASAGRSAGSVDVAMRSSTVCGHSAAMTRGPRGRARPGRPRPAAARLAVPAPRRRGGHGELVRVDGNFDDRRLAAGERSRTASPIASGRST